MIREDRGTSAAPEPSFTVSEVAKFFFGRSPHWIRWLERDQKLTLGGDPLCSHVGPWPGRRTLQGDEPTTSPPNPCPLCWATLVAQRRSESRHRIYSLRDVADITHVLGENGAITGRQVTLARALIQAEARVWNLM